MAILAGKRILVTGLLSNPTSDFTLAVGAPGPPTGLAATIQAGTVTITWVAPTTGVAAVSFQLEAGSGPLDDCTSATALPGRSSRR